MIFVMKPATGHAVISEATRDAYIEKGLKHMMKHPKKDNYQIQTGDMIILFTREYFPAEGLQKECTYIEVTDCLICRSGSKVV